MIAAALAKARGLVRRMAGAGQNKHFYPTLARLRSWTVRDVVFDVGANDGRTVRTLMRSLPVAPLIFAFEPVAATYEELQLATGGWSNVRTFPYAMGDAPGRAEIQLHELSVMNSFLVEGAGQTELVEVRTVDDMMDELAIDFVHFLKIDTEGFEANVLRGADRALAEARIGIVQAEFHLTEVEGLQRIHETLAGHGYEIFGIFNQNRRQVRDPAPWTYEAEAGFTRNALHYADVVYVYTGRRSEPRQPALM